MKFYMYDPGTQQVKRLDLGAQLQTFMLFNYAFIQTEGENYLNPAEITPEFFNV